MNENQNQSGDVTIKINPKNMFQAWLAYTGIKCGCVAILIIAVLVFGGYFLVKSWPLL